MQDNSNVIASGIVSSFISGYSQGNLAKTVIKKEYPNLPPAVGCGLAYYFFDKKNINKSGKDNSSNHVNVSNQSSSGSSVMTDSYNNRYAVTINQHGAQLKSSDTTIFLGNGCDAYSPQYGTGTWGWANGGVTADLNNGTISFPRQDSPFDDSRCGI